MPDLLCAGSTSLRSSSSSCEGAGDKDEREERSEDSSPEGMLGTPRRVVMSAAERVVEKWSGRREPEHDVSAQT
jgi:hypothetical protein